MLRKLRTWFTAAAVGTTMALAPALLASPAQAADRTGVIDPSNYDWITPGAFCADRQRGWIRPSETGKWYICKEDKRGRLRYLDPVAEKFVAARDEPLTE